MGFPGQDMPPMGMGMGVGMVPDFGNHNGPNLGGPRLRPPQAQQDQQRPAEAAVPIAVSLQSLPVEFVPSQVEDRTGLAARR